MLKTLEWFLYWNYSLKDKILFGAGASQLLCCVWHSYKQQILILRFENIKNTLWTSHFTFRFVGKGKLYIEACWLFQLLPKKVKLLVLLGILSVSKTILWKGCELMKTDKLWDFPSKTDLFCKGYEKLLKTFWKFRKQKYTLEWLCTINVSQFDIENFGIWLDF